MSLTEEDVVMAVEQLTVRRLRLWVRKGWVAPRTSESGPRFDEMDVARIRLICEFKDELNVNEDAVPIVLSLLDQLYGARRELRQLAAAIERQPEDVRQRIRSVVAELRSR